MGYSRNNGRKRRASATDQGLAVPPQRIIIPLAWVVGVVMQLLHWPGMIPVLLGYGLARVMARPPQFEGKDPWGYPGPTSKSEQREDRAYRKLTAWFTQPKDWVTTPSLMVWLGVGALTGIGRPGPWLGLLEWAACSWWLMMREVVARSNGMKVRRANVPWSRKQLPRMLTGMIPGLLLGGWWTVAWRTPWPVIGLTLLCGGLAAWIPGLREARKRCKRDRMAYDLLDQWLRALPKPPVPEPLTVRNTHQGDTTLLARVSIMGEKTPWIDGKLARQLAPEAQASHYRVAFAPVKNSERDVDMILVPDQPTDYGSIGDSDMRAWIMWDTALTGTEWHCLAPRVSRLMKVSAPDSKKSAWRVDFAFVDGTSLHVVDRDWLQGANTDLGEHMGALITPAPNGEAHWLLPKDWKDTVTFDDQKAMRGVGSSFSSIRDCRTYLQLLARSKEDRGTWMKALNRAKLDPPVIKYDTLDTLRNPSGDWELETVNVNAPQGATSGQYVPVDLRPAFGDARIADLLPRQVNDVWSDRMMMFVRSYGNAPTRMDRLLARRNPMQNRLERLLGRVIVTHAFSQVFGCLFRVDEPRGVVVGAPVWRVPVQLPDGITIADVTGKLVKLRGALGSPFLLAERVTDTEIGLWCGVNPLGLERAQWVDKRDRLRLIRLRLDAAWLAAGVKGADGTSPQCVGVEDDPTGMIHASFRLPAGIGVEACMMKLDRFKASAGFLYARQENSGTAGELNLLLGVEEPLPRAVDADWHLMADRSEYGRLPFGVTDRRDTAYFDLKVSPHLMVSGTTGSGKSSTGQVLASSALLKGWMLFVCDAEKGANDFLPLKPYCSGFATDLPHVTATVDWVYGEMLRRVGLLKEHGAKDVNDLPDDVRPPRIMLLIDEFNSLCGEPMKQMTNRGDDPTITNMNLRIVSENGMRARIGDRVCKLAAQARTAGIMLLLLGQTFTADGLKSLPDPGGLKRNLARLFIGQGDAAGNVSTTNVRAANQLIRSFGDMPKGRGVFELLGRGVDGVQCWWSGGPERMAQAMTDARLVPVSPVDVSGLLPAPPKTVGIMEDEPEEPVDEPTVTVEVAPDSEDGFGDFF